MCLPAWFRPEPGTVQGDQRRASEPAPTSTPCQIHTTWERCISMICPVGESEHPDAELCLPVLSLCVTQCEVGIFTVMDKIYGGSLCGRGNPMCWSWTSVLSFYSSFYLWPCWLVAVRRLRYIVLQKNRAGWKMEQHSRWMMGQYSSRCYHVRISVSVWPGWMEG